MQLRKRSRIPGRRPDAVVAQAPGTLQPMPGSHPSKVFVTGYGPDVIHESELMDFNELDALRGKYGVVWIDVVGLGTVDVLTGLADKLGLHRLALEDVLNIPQRPKIDEYGDHHFIVARMPMVDRHLQTEQISMFLGERYVVTCQERPGDCFDSIRARIRSGRPRIRGSGPDYLVYALLDAITDAYFPLLEEVAGRMDALEESILRKPKQHHIEGLYSLKRELVTLRRYLAPLRDLNSTLLRPDNPILSEETQLFMRDCYDHSTHALALVESYRDIASGLMELYLSVVSHRMNEVMKVLTIIATVFIPLSFIAGLYGMNFDSGVSRWNMPELGWKYGYPAALGFMGACALGMLTYFWKKGWFK